jgi:hypothetical protein
LVFIDEARAADPRVLAVAVLLLLAAAAAASVVPPGECHALS